MSAGKVPPKGSPERSEYFAELVRRRWSKPRPAPVDKRVRTLPAGSKLEGRWMVKAVDIGRVTVDEHGNATNMSRGAWRRLAKRLADDDTTRRVARIHEAKPADLDDDDDLLLAHLAAEAARLRARAKRDYRIASAHDLLADQAESELTDLMFRLGLTS